MIIEGRAVVVEGNDIDTYVLYPGQFLTVLGVEKMKNHLFEGLDPSLRDELTGETVLVVGENFGTGSSREHVPHAMKASGIRCVLGASFARIFQRNCVNLGLLVMTAPEAAAAAQTGDLIRIDTDSGEVCVGEASFQATPLLAFMLEMIRAGGLVGWGRRRLSCA